MLQDKLTSDLGEALGALRKWTEETSNPQITTLEAQGRTFVCSMGEYKEVKPYQRKGFAIGNLGGPVDLCKVLLELPHTKPVVVTVGPGGIFAECGIDGDERLPAQHLHAPFFTEHGPGRLSTVEELWTWLDWHKGNVGQKEVNGDEEAALRFALSSLRVEGTSFGKVEERGGAIVVSYSSSSGVGGDTPIPKWIRVRHAYGSREYKWVLTYRLTIRKSREDGIAVALQHVPTDGAFEAWQSWALETCDRLLGDEAIVVAGAGRP